MINKERLANNKINFGQVYIILGFLWLLLFVWYGPELGLLPVYDQFKLDLQNIFVVVYCVAVFAFTYVFTVKDYIIAARVGVIGTLSGLLIYTVLGSMWLFLLISTFVMAIFSASFSLSIVYIFVYQLTPPEQGKTIIYMIAFPALFLIIATAGSLIINKPIYYFLSFLLLLSLYICTLGFSSNLEVQYQTRTNKIPAIKLYIGLLLVASVQFINHIGIVLIQYNSFGEGSTYLLFYAGQLLAAALAYLLIVKFSYQAYEIFYGFFFAAVTGFVLIMVSSVTELKLFNAGIILVGCCEIGTICQWLIAARLCQQYKEIWILRSFFLVFALSTIAGALIGSFLLGQGETLFYVISATVVLLFISLFFLSAPILIRLQRVSALNLEIPSSSPIDSQETNISAPNPDPESQDSPAYAKIINLTKRENEITRLLLEGYTAPQIGDILDIKLNTAKVHIRNIYEKLEIKSRPELFLKYGNKNF